MRRMAKRMGGTFGMGFARSKRGGPPPTAISFTRALWPVPEGTSAGTLIGTASVTNGTGTYTFTEDSDVDSRFALAGTNGEQVNVAGAWNFEGDDDGYHVLRLKADNGAGSVVYRTLRVPIGNVLEVTLGDISLDADTLYVGVPDSGAIVGAQSGEDLEATGVPAGLTLDLEARTWSWDGSGSVTAFEIEFTGTHADAANSPHVSSFAGEVAAAPELRVALVVVHTDSRGRGIFTADRPGDDDWPAWLTQYVSDFATPGTADNGYPLTPGFTAEVPLQGAATYESTDYLSPMEHAARRIYDDGDYDHVVLIGSHWGGERLVDSLTFHLPYTIAKMEAALVDAEAEFAGAVFDKLIDIQFGANDLAGAEDPADVRTAMEATIAGLLGADGWSDAKLMGVSCTPEILSSYDARVDTACRIPFLDGVGYWQQLPTGLGTLHEGETFTIAEVRSAGYDHMGRTASVALGLIAPAAPSFTLTDNFEVVEGSDTEISVSCDQPFYLTGMSVGGSLATFSPDLELVNQVIRPVGDAWPAYDAGTPANNTRAYTPAYITGDRVTGTLPRHVVITEAVAVTYLAYDDFNRANTTPSSSGLGTTSGDGTSGDGLTWVVRDYANAPGYAGIDTNKARVQWDGGGGGLYNRCGVDVGTADVKVRCTVTMSGSAWKPGIFAAVDIDTNYGVFMRADGSCYLQGVFGTHSFGSFTPPSGTFELGIDINTTTDEATFYVDGAVVLGPVQTGFGDAIPATAHYAGFDTIYIADDHRWDNFNVVART